MTQDLQDRLLDWITREQTLTLKFSRSPETNAMLKEFYKGKLVAYLDIKAFIMSDGVLSESTRTTRT